MPRAFRYQHPGAVYHLTAAANIPKLLELETLGKLLKCDT